MNLPNHIVGGTVITGIFSAISGVNIFTYTSYIIITIIASIIPDIDHPNSPVGKAVLPLSRYINKNHGHRTITHSLLFLGTMTLIVYIIEQYIIGSGAAYSIITFWGIFSHIILDMITKSGVYIFYPWIRNRPAVIPGKEDLRISTNNVRAELTVFGFFCVSAWFLTPLFQNGFWTSYNRTFGTIKHVHSEFRKAKDLLEIEYTLQEGSKEITGLGYCIEASKSKLLLLSKEEKFITLDNTKMIVKKAIPNHTGKQWNIKTQQLIGISIDSINRLLYRQPILEIELHSNIKFTTNKSQNYHTKFKAESTQNVQIIVQQLHIEKEKIAYQANPRIATIKTQINQLRKEHNNIEDNNQKHQQRITQTEQQLANAVSLYDRQKITKELKELKSKPLKTPNYNEIQTLQSKVRELERQDYQNHKLKQDEANRQYQEKRPQTPYFTGFYKTIHIDSSNAITPN